MKGQGSIDLMIQQLEILIDDPSYMAEQLQDIKDTLQAKGEDNQGTEETPGTAFNNFLLQALLSGLEEPEKAFYVHLTRKVIRLIISQQHGRKPNYEDTADGWLDLGGYVVLMAAFFHFRERYGENAIRTDLPDAALRGIRDGAVSSGAGASDDQDRG